MSDQRFRRALFFGSLIAFGLLLALGFVFWRTLPPVIPPALRANADAKEYAGAPSNLPTALRQPRLDGIRVALINEPENVRITPAGYYGTELARWRQWLTELGAQLVAAQDADVLIAPEARCLGPIDRRRINDHLKKGRGMISTGALGALDGVCSPLRDTLLVQMLGSRGSVRPAPRRGTESYYALILGETVLGADVPPGSRIELTPVEEIVFKNPAREILYTTYERRPLNAGEQYFDAVAARVLVGTGRLCAFGYAIQNLTDEWSRTLGKIIAANAIRWAAGFTTYQIAPWPDGKQAAGVMAQDVEADYQNAVHALDALDKYDIPGTAFIVGYLAQADPRTTARIKQDLEIASHTQRHLPLDTLSDDEQFRELQTAKRVAEEIAGKPVRGLRPPEERYNPKTLQIWADLGGDYIFTSTDGRAGAPEIIPMLPDSLVMLGRVAEDDYEILSRDGLRDRKLMARLITHQMSEIVAYRGLFLFSYHSHMFSQKELVSVLEAVAAKLKGEPGFWITTAGEVARWWRARSKVEIQPAKSGAYVTLRNHNEVAFTQGVLIIDLANGARKRVQIPTLQPGGAVQVDSLGQLLANAQPPVRRPAAF